MMYSYDGKLLTNKKELIIDACKNMINLKILWLVKEPDIKAYILNDSIYMKF